MKKYLSMIALAIASVMVFSSCSKDDDPVKPEDPTEEKSNFEVEVNAAISGAMAKALELTINYIDFEGNKQEVVLNKDFSGAEPMSFKETFKTNEEGKKFGIRITARNADFNTYKDVPAPWVASYSVVGKVNGKETRVDFIDEKSQSDSQTLFSYDIDWPHRVATGINNMYLGMRYVVVDKEKGIAKFE